MYLAILKRELLVISKDLVAFQLGSSNLVLLNKYLVSTTYIRLNLSLLPFFRKLV